MWYGSRENSKSYRRFETCFILRLMLLTCLLVFSSFDLIKTSICLKITKSGDSRIIVLNLLIDATENPDSVFGEISGR